jgi:peptidyl-dipeptidase A
MLTGSPLLTPSMSLAPGGEVYVDPQKADALGRLIRLRNQLARRERFNNYYALAMRSQGLDVSEHLALLNGLEEATRPSYRRLIDSLAARRGVDAASMQDLLATILGQGGSSIWDNFPADSEFILIRQSLAAIGFNLNRLPIYFDDTETADVESGMACVPVKPPYDVRIYAYRQGRVRESLYQLGRALHWTQVADDRPLFNALVSPVWREGVSRVFGHLSDEATWLERYAHASAPAIEGYRRERSLTEIARLRWTLMHLMFEYEAYRDPNRNLNQLYWQLVSEHLLLPAQEGPDYWALVKDYARRPIQMHNDLYGEIIAAQTLAYLEEQYGGLVDNQDAYSFLVQNYMRFGSRYPWRDLLQRGTTQPLDPEHYFARLGL